MTLDAKKIHISLDLQESSDLTLPCAHFYRGSTYCDRLPLRDPAGFHEKGEWSNGYRTVWINEPERAILTYCEGDLDLTIDDTQEQFSVRLESAAKFYAEVN